MSSIPGYTHGTSAVAKSPLTLTDFEQMKASVLFGEGDVKYLRMSLDVVKEEVEHSRRLVRLRREPAAPPRVVHGQGGR